MENGVVFKKATFGGFDKQSVMDYLYELNTSTIELQDDLTSQINALRAASEKHDQASKELEAKLQAMEKSRNHANSELAIERDRVRDLQIMMESQNNEQTNLIAIKNSEINSCHEKLQEWESREHAILQANSEINSMLESTQIQVDEQIQRATYSSQKMLDEADQKAKELVSNAENSAGELVSNAQNKAIELVSDAENKAIELVSNAENKANELVSNAENKAYELVSNAENKANEIFSEVEQKALNITNSAEQIAQSTLNAAVEKADSVIGSAKEQAEKSLADASFKADESTQKSQKVICDLKSQFDEYKGNITDAYAQLQKVAETINKQFCDVNNSIQNAEAVFATEIEKKYTTSYSEPSKLDGEFFRNAAE